MISLYYSQDWGLLDNKVREFKLNHPKAKNIKKPDIKELNVFLLQMDLFNSDNNYLVEDYSGSFSELEEFLQSIKHDDMNILFVQRSEENFHLSDSFKNLLANPTPKIPRLTESTKKSYLDARLKDHHIKLSKDLIKEIKLQIPTNGSEINEFVAKLSLIPIPTLQNISDLLKDSIREVNYFNFWGEYLKIGEFGWLHFFKNPTKDEVRKIFHPLVYKLYEFKSFVSLRVQGISLEEVAKELKLKPYFLKEYDLILKRVGSPLRDWLHSFIIDLYFLLSDLRFSSPINVELFKYFLVKKQLELRELS
ncbi:hypothetical protein MHC_00585 [Mycoplasma haemocanis str. Illinois]|uniref:DNA polymerase III, delta subunit n=1 Tax=Mycoplasma haemocanis (strain Illinois) TaxID=1111676 RepID=H6N5M3_MYCHN|nr:hypothetical protein [Mycoplasma haemocanis]AEW44983.1 hypothetical protein MHC_00585 [Mycoplasma haemocanis str. Illinois]